MVGGLEGVQGSLDCSQCQTSSEALQTHQLHLLELCGGNVISLWGDELSGPQRGEGHHKAKEPEMAGPVRASHCEPLCHFITVLTKRISDSVGGASPGNTVTSLRR